MSKSTSSRRARKAPDRPKKPYSDFPLTPHASGAWMKKIRGRLYYFGRWANRVDGKLTRIPGDNWEAALGMYQEQRDDLHAGRTPRVKDKDGLNVAELCNRFLTAKLRKQEAGELSARMFAEYRETTDLIVAAFGSNRLVDDLAAGDFEALRATLAKTWGPVRLANGITRVKSVFYGTDNGLIDKAVRYGGEFKKPDHAVLRRHRVRVGEKLFSAEEIRALIDGALVPGDEGPELLRADVTMRAMILLGINAGLGNNDCATLPFSALDLDHGWLIFPRPKTGIARRCPLWLETVAAIREAIAARPKPADYPRAYRPAPGATMPTAQHARIFVVDDDRDVVESIVILLASAGFYVAGACGGPEAIKVAAADPPDVALVDLEMPGLDGFEVARRIREGTSRPLVLVAMTGLDWDRQRAADAGFVLCLTKPIPPRELVAVIRECAKVYAPA